MQHRHKEVVELLVNVGDDVNARTLCGEETVPLVEAAIHGHTDIAEILLDRGANINAADHEGCTSLDMAIGEGHIELAEILKNRGAVKKRQWVCLAAKQADCERRMHIQRMLLISDGIDPMF